MALQLRSVLQAVGLTITESQTSGKGYEIVKVQYQAPFGPESKTLLYLDSDISFLQLQKIKKDIGDLVLRQVSEVLVARSAAIVSDLKRVANEVGIKQPARTLHALLEGTLNKSVKAKTDADSDPFLDPSIFEGGGELPPKDLGKKALDILTNWMTSSPAREEPRLGVLLAPGGVGKTTVSSHLAAELKKAQKVPVLVTADRWVRLSAVSDITLWDIWQAALQAEGLGFSSQESFETYVKAGIIVPILDGFDELCSQRSDHFKPDEVIQSLIALLENEEGRVLLTSRDSYWNEYVPEELKAKLWSAQLYPFNRQQVMGYFRQGFGPKQKDDYERASDILSLLQKSIPVEDGPNWRKSPLGVPAVINLIREAAIGTSDGATPLPQSKAKGIDAVEWILQYVCERERTRRLPHASTKDQLAFFRELAVELKEPISRDQIDTWRGFYLPDLDSYQSEADALPSHFLFSRTETHNYRFRFQLIPEYLAATWLSSWIIRQSPTLKDTDNFSAALALLERHGVGADTFIDKVAETLHRLGTTEGKVAIDQSFRSAWERVRNEGKRPHAISGLLHLGLRLAEEGSKVGPRADRTQRWLELIGAKQFTLENAYLEGSVTSLDLSDAVFRKCTFKNAGFVRCKFTAASRFVNCFFEGSLDLQGSEGLPKVIIENCRYSPEAKAAFQKVVGQTGALAITQEQVRDTIREALKQFGMGGKQHPISMTITRRGKVGASPIGPSVWQALEKCLVIRKGDLGRGNDSVIFTVPEEAQASVLQFLNNGLATGPVLKAFNLLIEELKLL